MVNGKREREEQAHLPSIASCASETYPGRGSVEPSPRGKVLLLYSRKCYHRLPQNKSHTLSCLLLLLPLALQNLSLAEKERSVDAAGPSSPVGRPLTSHRLTSPVLFVLETPFSPPQTISHRGNSISSEADDILCEEGCHGWIRRVASPQISY